MTQGYEPGNFTYVEAKALGIKMGEPEFKLRKLTKRD